MKWKFCNLDIFRLRSWSTISDRISFSIIIGKCLPLCTNSVSNDQNPYLLDINCFPTMEHHRNQHDCMIWTWLIGFLLQGFFCSFPFILISISKWFVIQHKVLFNVQEYDEITFTRSCKCFMMKDKWSHIYAVEENWAIIKS